MSYNKISCIIDIISPKLCQILVFIGLPDAWKAKFPLLYFNFPQNSMEILFHDRGVNNFLLWVWWWLARSIFLFFCKLCGGAVAWWRSDSLGHWVCWQGPDTAAVQFCVCRQTPAHQHTAPPVPACSIQNMFAVPGICPCSTNRRLSVILESKTDSSTCEILSICHFNPIQIYKYIFKLDSRNPPNLFVYWITESLLWAVFSFVFLSFL